MSGLFRRIRDRFGGDDEKKEEAAEQEAQAEQAQAEAAQQEQVEVVAEDVSATASTDAGSTSTSVHDIVARADAERAVAAAAAAAGPVEQSSAAVQATAPPVSASQPAAATTAAAATSTAGSVFGAGIERTYVSREGDTLEAIGAYFYGDPVQKQRLIDDNAWLQAYDGKPLPAGMEIKVGEDPNWGDAVPG